MFLDTNFLESDEIKLILEKTTEADPVKNWVPAYHFLICDRQGTVMGRCALRIGYIAIPQNYRQYPSALNQPTQSR